MQQITVITQTSYSNGFHRSWLSGRRISHRRCPVSSRRFSPLLYVQKLLLVYFFIRCCCRCVFDSHFIHSFISRTPAWSYI